jgi:hypothetical protein
MFGGFFGTGIGKLAIFYLASTLLSGLIELNDRSKVFVKFP